MEEASVQRLKDELTQKTVGKLRRSDMLVVYQKWCKACGICYDLCPQGTLDADEEGIELVALSDLDYFLEDMLRRFSQQH